MTRLLGAAGLAVAVGTTAVAAQDPTKTIPDSYKVEFENDYVRVVQVHYAAGAKLPEHTHPAGTTVYLYLNDSEGVVFRHVGGSNSAVTRPPVQGGAIRIATGREEHHTAENNSTTASHFLRIYFKTDNAGVNNLRRRMPIADQTFENKQMRLTRVEVPAGQNVRLEATQYPALIVRSPLGAQQWYQLPNKWVMRWLEPGQTLNHHNASEEPHASHLLRIDFLTKPRK